ncbi:MAG: MBL fold metallo-hydrolase [Candidatus Ranarchaeia archaeon]
MPSTSLTRSSSPIPQASPTIRITALVENLANQSHVVAEHGLSLFVEYTVSGERTYRILFDTGQTGDTLIQNIKSLGVELSPLDAIVLSHGHYDHTGGLKHIGELLHNTRHSHNLVPVYLHPDALKKKYAGTRKKRSIGFPFAQHELEQYFSFRFISGPTKILPGTWLTGEIPRIHPFQPGKNLFIKAADGSYEPDPLVDDLSLILVLSQGKVVITGCGHAGIINITRYAEQIGPMKPIYALIGGLHLRGLSDQELKPLLDEIRPLNLQVIAPCHCCDLHSRQKIAEAFPDQYRLLSVGDTLVLPNPAKGVDPLA